MATFIWTTESGMFEVEAANEEGAYRKVIGYRVSLGQTATEAISWFRENDRLDGPVIGKIDAAPYDGEIPEE
jgi:hypothetical protein